MEAGFPIASAGDFEAVQQVSREVPGQGRGAGARHRARRRARGQGARGREGGAAHPRLPGHQRHPPQVQAEEDARAGARRGGRGRRAGAQVRRRRRVLRRGRRAHAGRVPDRGLARGRRRRRHARSTSPTPSGTASPRSTARSSGRSRARSGTSAIVSVHCHNDLGPGGRQLARRHPERRAPGRVHGQRHRRARRQLLARGDRDGAEDPRRSAALRDRHQDRAALSGEPAADRDHRRRRPAEQGDRRRATPSRTRPASTRTASSRSGRPTRSSSRRASACPRAASCSASTAAGTRSTIAARSSAWRSTSPSSTRSTPASPRWPIARRGSPTTRSGRLADEVVQEFSKKNSVISLT